MKVGEARSRSIRAAKLQKVVTRIAVVCGATVTTLCMLAALVIDMHNPSLPLFGRFVGFIVAVIVMALMAWMVWFMEKLVNELYPPESLKD